MLNPSPLVLLNQIHFREYEIAGKCCIHGIMYGEVMDDLNSVMCINALSRGYSNPFRTLALYKAIEVKGDIYTLFLVSTAASEIAAHNKIYRLLAKCS
jgi:hypothetical protein